MYAVIANCTRANVIKPRLAEDASSSSHHALDGVLSQDLIDQIAEREARGDHDPLIIVTQRKTLSRFNFFQMDDVRKQQKQSKLIEDEGKPVKVKLSARRIKALKKIVQQKSVSSMNRSLSQLISSNQREKANAAVAH